MPNARFTSSGTLLGPPVTVSEVAPFFADVAAAFDRNGNLYVVWTEPTQPPRARAYDQNGDYPNAKAAYQQALAMKPGDAGVLNNFALSRMQAGDLSGARQLMTQAQITGGGDPKIARNVARNPPPTETRQTSHEMRHDGGAATSAPKSFLSPDRFAAPVNQVVEVVLGAPWKIKLLLFVAARTIYFEKT